MNLKVQNYKSIVYGKITDRLPVHIFGVISATMLALLLVR